ncbi:hypothetical protein PQR06_15115 [Paraburkholderia graminis]|uniref:hypothetical protein n=1 Tax=Paraburkholderia graminis TaxID=60548 RepID=UPI0038B878BC
MSRSADELREMGFLYPGAGRLGEISGHHNIAWQLTRDRRFAQSLGTLDTLFDEIEHFDGDVILSSEDFEGVLTCPAKWPALVQRASRAGLVPIAIIYLRNQAAYLESLYQEMVAHGFGEEFGIYSESMLRSGSLRLKEWRFQFDYNTVAESTSSIYGLNVLFRNYHALAGGSVISDFFDAIDALAPQHIQQSRANARDPIGDSLTHFYRNRVQRALEDSEAQAIEQLLARMSGEPRLSPGLLEKIAERFAEPNRRICDLYSVDPRGLTDFSRPGAATSFARVEKLFSFETQLAIASIATLLDRRASKQLQQVDLEQTRVLEDWQNWIHSDP